MKKLFLALLAVGTVFLLTLVVFHKRLISFGVSVYAARKGVDLNFDLIELSQNRISLENLKLEKGSQLKTLSVEFKRQPAFEITKINFSGEKLDVNEVIGSAAKLAPPSQSQTVTVDDVYDQVKLACDIIKPLEVKLTLDYLNVSGRNIPVALSIMHESGHNEIHLQVSGRISELSKNIKRISETINVTLDCNDALISLKVPDSMIEFEKVAIEEIKIEKATIGIKEFSLAASGDGKADIDVPLSIGVVFVKDGKEFQVQSQLLQFSGLADLRDNIFNGRVDLKKFVLTDIANNKHFGPLELRGPVKFEANKISGKLNSYWGKKKDKLLNIDYLHDMEADKSSLKFKSKEGIKVSLAEEYLPKSLADILGDLSGLLRVEGNISVSKEGPKGYVHFKSDDLGVSSEALEIKKLSIDHDIVDFEKFSSTAEREIKIKEVKYGPLVKEIQGKYKLESVDKILVNQIGFSFEDARFSAENFTVNIEQKVTTPFEMKVKNMDLEKFLKLSLGESVSATGILEGYVKVKFVNSVPVIADGKLKALKPGVIRYRPPNSPGPPDPTSFSADPMTILNSYLYDLRYNSLDVSLKSDEKYNMTIRLGTLGHNPGYLNGKALKLNVNLEQNLLAAFKSMMMTYDLPEKLQKKISNMGSI